MKSLPTVRRATRKDAAQLAAFMDIASRGLATWLWSTLISPGHSPIEAGRARICERRDLPSHFSNWRIVENGGEVVGAFAGHVIPDPYDMGDVSDLPDVYKPILELECLAAGCWFLSALSVYREFRRRGLGTFMLDAAFAEAKKCAATRMALTVGSANNDALALYTRFGFEELARRPSVGYPGSPGVEDWILLTKTLKS